MRAPGSSRGARGVRRKQIDGDAIRQPDRELLVLDEHVELERAGRVAIAAQILLQLGRSDLGFRPRPLREEPRMPGLPGAA